MPAPADLPRIRKLAGDFPGLRLLVLHGSRARLDANARSDWDFAWLGDESLDDLGLRSRLGEILRTDDIDLADLKHAGGLLRYRVAKDGMLLFEREKGTFEQLCCDAASFWFDIEHIVRTEHAAILDALG